MFQSPTDGPVFLPLSCSPGSAKNSFPDEVKRTQMKEESKLLEANVTFGAAW